MKGDIKMGGNAADEANANQSDVELIENDQVQSADEGADKSLTPEKDKQIDNAEASRIGRIVKNQLERALGEVTKPLQDEISSLRTTVSSYQKLSPTEKNDEWLPLPPVDGFPTNKEEFLAMNQWADDCKRIKREKEVAKYSGSYISAINGLREEGGDLHAQIQELLTKDGSPYNVTHGSGIGSSDATINYYRAKSDILANKVKTPSNPFKGKQTDVATGVTATSRIAATKQVGKTTSDDQKTNEFMDYLGWDEAKRAEFLSKKG